MYKFFTTSYASELEFACIIMLQKRAVVRGSCYAESTIVDFRLFLLKRVALRLNQNRKQSKEVRIEKAIADNHVLEKENHGDKGGQKC